MIKQLFSLLILFLTINSLFSQTEFLTDSIFIQQNKISKITNRRLSPFDLYGKNKGDSYTVHEYNKEGFVVKQSFYNKGELQGTVQNEYNLKKQIVKKIDVSKINNAETIYSYNDQGEPITVEYLRHNYPNYKYVYEYKDGKKVRQFIYYDNNDLQNKEQYTYNNGRLHTVAYYSGKADTAYNKILLHYDANGNEVWRQILKGAGNYYQKKQYDSEHRLIHATYVDYDGKKITGEEWYTWKEGKLIKKKLEMKESELQTIITSCTYTNGLLTEHDYNSNLYRNKSSTSYSYNSDSLLTCVTHYFNDKVTQKVNFKYNKQKQLISKQHAWPTVNYSSGPISIGRVAKKQVAKKVAGNFAGITTYYTYDEKGDTLLKKIVQDKYEGNYVGGYYSANMIDTTIYDFREKMEFKIQYGKHNPATHFEYGSLTRIRTNFIDWDLKHEYDAPQPISVDILDTIKNTVVNGKGELVLKLQPYDIYGQKTKHRIIRTIHYESPKIFIATDADSLNNVIMKLDVRDSNYVSVNLISLVLKKEKEQNTFSFTTSYGPKLSEIVQFDDEQRPVKRTIISYPNTQIINYDYSKVGEAIETEDYSGGFKQTKVHFYNNKGQEIKEIVFDASGQISAEKEFIIKNGHCIGTKSQLPAAHYIDRYEYEFYK